MEQFRLGRTELMVSRSGFGAIPIQRIDFEDTKQLLRRAYDGGINFFDTARAYTDSEEKIGQALSDVRHHIYIATKSGASDAKTLNTHLETSLANLKTDYIDIYQLHNPSFDIEEDHEVYQAVLKAKKEGKIRFISITSHRFDYALRMLDTNLFDTMQFPVSSLSSPEDLSVVEKCRQKDIGVIGMKGMSGGLITDPASTFAFIRSLDNVLPIWGIQYEWQLEQFLALEQNPPALNDELWAKIEADKKELCGAFCRGCGYCVPTCPAKIDISIAARMSLMLKRASVEVFTSKVHIENMERIQNCIHCGECTAHCPYGLDTPALLQREYTDYQAFLAKQELK